MTTQNTSLLWSNFRGIRKLNSINSVNELGADDILNVTLSKEKSGQNRSIRSSGWFNEYLTAGENVIRLFPAQVSSYTHPNQLIAFTKTASAINAWIVEDDSGILTPAQIATFPIATDVTDCCMVQFGDRMAVVVAFGNNTLGFITYSGSAITGWTAIGNWYYRVVQLQESTTQAAISDVYNVKPYRSRLAITGKTTYTDNSVENIYGVWFSEAGNPTNFTHTFITTATETSPFFVETTELANAMVEYHGLTCFGNNASYNITGTTADDITVEYLTAKGVFGNAAFVLNGQCAYVDGYAKNVFILTNNIDGTIGFDSPIGNDIQDYLNDTSDVSINTIGRKIRVTKKSTGQSLTYDVDIAEWTTESFVANARCVTFLNKEIFCNNTTKLYRITEKRTTSSTQTPNSDGYYSYYKSNLIWLDSQTSVKSHIYPFAVILEPQTNNDFYIKLTTDRKNTIVARVTRSAYINIATYSENDSVPADGSKFVSSDSDHSGGNFFSITGNELLITVDNPPFWRYLTVEIYTTSATMEFNISGIEAKNTFITNEQLDY